jgi:O-antigen ligase
MLRRLVLWSFLAFVFSSTFSIALSQLSLGICAILFITMCVQDRINPFIPKLKLLWLAIGLYVGWLLVVCLVQDDPWRALDHIREEWLFVIIPIGLFVMRKVETRKLVVLTLASGLLLVSVASILMTLFAVQYHYPEGFQSVTDAAYRLHGNFAHALTFGSFASVSSVLFLAWALIKNDFLSNKSKKEWWLLVAAGVSGLVATTMGGSRGPLLAIVLGLLVLLLFLSWRQRRWLLACLVGGLLLASLVPGLQSRFTSSLDWQLRPEWPGGRLFIWDRTLEMAGESPFIGVGPGNFGDVYPTEAIRNYGPKYFKTHAHNDFLQALVRAGIPGLVTFGFLWFCIWQYFWVSFRRDRAGATGRGVILAGMLGSLVFLLGSMTEASFADEEVRALLMLVWAIGLSVEYKSGGEASVSNFEPAS